jgi:hypothetical protein
MEPLLGICSFDVTSPSSTTVKAPIPVACSFNAGFQSFRRVAVLSARAL